MNAHPNKVIANEYTIIRKLASNSIKVTKEAIFNTLYQHSTADLKEMKARRTKGYTLGTKGYWQGKFSILKVIGDKRGDEDATYLYSKTPENFTELYKHLSADVFQDPIRVMVVIRNPYDRPLVSGYYWVQYRVSSPQSSQW